MFPQAAPEYGDIRIQAGIDTHRMVEPYDRYDITIENSREGRVVYRPGYAGDPRWPFSFRVGQLARARCIDRLARLGVLGTPPAPPSRLTPHDTFRGGEHPYGQVLVTVGDQEYALEGRATPGRPVYEAVCAVRAAVPAKVWQRIEAFKREFAEPVWRDAPPDQVAMRYRWTRGAPGRKGPSLTIAVVPLYGVYHARLVHLPDGEPGDSAKMAGFDIDDRWIAKLWELLVAETFFEKATVPSPDRRTLTGPRAALVLGAYGRLYRLGGVSLAVHRSIPLSVYKKLDLEL